MRPRAAVLDIDGTLLRGGDPLPGARDAVAEIRERVEAVRFVTNNPTVPPAVYAERLREVGFDADAAEIVTAGAATVAYLREHHADDAVYAVAGGSVVAQLRDADLTLVDDPGDADCLVVGHDPGFDYGDMRDALALPADVAFVGTDPDRAVPTDDGLMPGSGAIVRAVAGVLDRDPDAVLGKPSAETARLVLDGLDVPPSACVLVGDNPATDVAFGAAVGMTTVRVRTGVTDDPAGPDETADHEVASVVDAVRFFR